MVSAFVTPLGQNPLTHHCDCRSLSQMHGMQTGLKRSFGTSLYQSVSVLSVSSFPWLRTTLPDDMWLSSSKPDLTRDSSSCESSVKHLSIRHLVLTTKLSATPGSPRRSLDHLPNELSPSLPSTPSLNWVTSPAPTSGLYLPMATDNRTVL